MNPPWHYDEAIRVGTDYRDQQEVSTYDERMLKLRDIDAEVKDIQRALSLSADATVWEINASTGECAFGLAGLDYNAVAYEMLAITDKSSEPLKITVKMKKAVAVDISTSGTD